MALFSSAADTLFSSPFPSSASSLGRSVVPPKCCQPKKLGASLWGSSIHRSSGKGNSQKFGLLLHVAVMFADGTLVLLLGPNMRVREARRALHSLLVHP